MSERVPREVTFADRANPPEEGTPPDDVMSMALDPTPEVPATSPMPEPDVERSAIPAVSITEAARTNIVPDAETVSDLLPPGFRRPTLLRESADPAAPQDEIVRMTKIGTPVRVSSREHRWYRRVKYD